MYDRRSLLKTGSAVAAASTLLPVFEVSAASSSDGLNHRSTSGSGPLKIPDVEWTASTGTVDHGVVTDDLYLSVDPGGGLHALDVEDGELVWSHDGDGSSVAGVDLHDDLAVYTSGNTTYGVDVSDGSQRWTLRERTPSASTANVVSGSVFVGRAAEVYELGSISGGARWSYETGGSVRARPAYDGEHVYAGSDDGKLYCLDEDLVEWELDIGGDVRAAPVVYGDVVHVVNTRGDYHGVDVDSGEEEWSRRLHTRVDRDAAIGAGHLFVPTDEGVLIAFDSDTGVEQWRFETEGSSAYPPFVADEAVYFTTGSTAYCLDAEEGVELWSLDVADGGSSLVAEGSIYSGGGSTSYRLMGEEPEADEQVGPDVQLTEARLEETEVEVGAPANVAAVVENHGDEDGEIQLTLYVDGEEADSVELEIASGNSTEHVFEGSFDEPGSYEITVNELEAGTLEVVADEVDGPAGFEVPLPGFGAGVASVSVAAGYLFRRFRDDGEDR